MDNKKWYKKFATIFWWAFTIMPLLVALIYFIGYHLTFNSGIATASELNSYHSMNGSSFYDYLLLVLNQFDLFTMSSLKNTFTGLFDILGITNYESMGILFGYMLSIQMYHLLFDMLVFFIHLIHNFMDSFNDKMY